MIRSQLEAGLARHAAKPHDVVMGPHKVLYEDAKILVRHFTDRGHIIQTNKQRGQVAIVIINHPPKQ